MKHFNIKNKGFEQLNTIKRDINEFKEKLRGKPYILFKYIKDLSKIKSTYSSE